MLQRLRKSFSLCRWDAIIFWRAVTTSEAVFANVPSEVIVRWARKDFARFDGYPEIQDAIRYAQGELAVRRLERERALFA